MSYKPGTTYRVTDTDCQTAFEQCKGCSFISSNERYKDCANRVYLDIEEDDDLVNAFAAQISDQARPYLQKAFSDVNWNAYDHLLIITGGMLRWITVMAAICEYMDRTRKIGEAKKMLIWAADRLTRSCAGTDFVERFADQFGLQCDGRREEVCRIYAIAMLVGIFGHELGHMCLGHCGQTAQHEQNSVSRNNERTADMFASSIAQSLANGFAGAVGAVFVDISFLWMDGKRNKLYGGKQSEFATHPMSRERVEMFIDSFNTVLETSPISAKMLRKLMKDA